MTSGVSRASDGSPDGGQDLLTAAPGALVLMSAPSVVLRVGGGLCAPGAVVAAKAPAASASSRAASVAGTPPGLPPERAGRPAP